MLLNVHRVEVVYDVQAQVAMQAGRIQVSCKQFVTCLPEVCVNDRILTTAAASTHTNCSSVFAFILMDSVEIHSPGVNFQCNMQSKGTSQLSGIGTPGGLSSGNLLSVDNISSCCSFRCGGISAYTTHQVHCHPSTQWSLRGSR